MFVSVISLQPAINLNFSPGAAGSFGVPGKKVQLEAAR